MITKFDLRINIIQKAKINIYSADGVIPHNDCDINNIILKRYDYAMFRYAQNCTYTNCVCDNLCNFNYTYTSLSVYDNDVKFTSKIISKRTLNNNWNGKINVIGQVVN